MQCMARNTSYLMFTVSRKETFLKKWPLILKQLTTDQTVSLKATNKLPTAVVFCRTRPVSQNLTTPDGSIQTKQRLCRRRWRSLKNTNWLFWCSTKLLSCYPWQHKDFDNNEVFGFSTSTILGTFTLKSKMVINLWLYVLESHKIALLTLSIKKRLYFTTEK